MAGFFSRTSSICSIHNPRTASISLLSTCQRLHRLPSSLRRSNWNRIFSVVLSVEPDSDFMGMTSAVIAHSNVSLLDHVAGSLNRALSANAKFIKASIAAVRDSAVFWWRPAQFEIVRSRFLEFTTAVARPEFGDSNPGGTSFKGIGFHDLHAFSLLDIQSSSNPSGIGWAIGSSARFLRTTALRPVMIAIAVSWQTVIDQCRNLSAENWTTNPTTLITVAMRTCDSLSFLVSRIDFCNGRPFWPKKANDLNFWSLIVSPFCIQTNWPPEGIHSTSIELASMMWEHITIPRTNKDVPITISGNA